MRPLEDWSDRKYFRLGVVAHVVPFGTFGAMCGAEADEMYGTGDMDEIERAARLPTCRACATKVGLEITSSDPDPAVAIWGDAMNRQT